MLLGVLTLSCFVVVEMDVISEVASIEFKEKTLAQIIFLCKPMTEWTWRKYIYIVWEELHKRLCLWTYKY